MTPDLTPGPMIRLTELQDPSEVEQRAMRLLASMPDEMPSETRKRRVREALLTRPPRRMSGWGPALLRPAAVITVLTSSAAIAGATVGRGFVSRAYESVREIFQPAEEAAKLSAVRPKRHVARASVPEVEALPPPAPHHADVPRSLERRPLRHTPPVVAPTPPPRDEEEAALVVSAMRALRKEHDAERAARLLDRYLAAHPEGALVEEAIALDLEASVARHDDARAQAFARQYLRRFPEGRFGTLARRTLSGATPHLQ